ncbi:MAG: cytochrome-c peroxidase [Gammaproteobacteria bacterium]
MNLIPSALAVWVLCIAYMPTAAAEQTTSAEHQQSMRAGAPALQKWLLPESPPAPKDNAVTAERVELGKMLFFDPRLSGDDTISCASCHNPNFGWSDAMPTGRGFNGQVLHRASPTVINTAYNAIQMWDGRARTLEQQATGPMLAASEMNMDLGDLVAWLKANPGYTKAFDAAYPGEAISVATLSKAIASFERTVISRDSPFDRWVSGDAAAITAQQIRGFNIFVDSEKGNCAVCHSAPNFTDDGFHNVGLASYLDENPDMGRFEHLPLGVMKGAFKTPTLRDITRTAPYFHDGSAATLADVVEHYARGGDIEEDLSPNMKPLNLSKHEKADLVAFLEALTSPAREMRLPDLPQDHLELRASRQATQGND